MFNKRWKKKVRKDKVRLILDIDVKYKTWSTMKRSYIFTQYCKCESDYGNV